MLKSYQEVKLLKAVYSTVPEKLKNINVERRTYTSGTVIHIDGDKIDAVGFVLKGVLKAVNYTHTGTEQSNRYFYEGSTLPVYMVLSKVSHYCYNLVCHKDCVVEWMALEDFYELVGSSVPVLKSLLTYVARDGYESQLLLRCLHHHTIEGRLASYLLTCELDKRDGWIYLPDTQKILAEKLHVSRTVLNQELIRFEKLGWILREKQRIKVAMKEKLEELL